MSTRSLAAAAAAAAEAYALLQDTLCTRMFGSFKLMACLARDGYVLDYDQDWRPGCSKMVSTPGRVGCAVGACLCLCVPSARCFFAHLVNSSSNRPQVIVTLACRIDALGGVISMAPKAFEARDRGDPVRPVHDMNDLVGDLLDSNNNKAATDRFQVSGVHCDGALVCVLACVLSRHHQQIARKRAKKHTARL